MKIPNSIATMRSLNFISNGLNHEACGSIECEGWFAYTVMSATVANSTSITTSKLSSTCCVRAESSMPRWQIQVISRIHSTAPTSAAPVCVSAQCHSTSLNEYVDATYASEAITSRSERKIAQPFSHPALGPNA